MNVPLIARLRDEAVDWYLKAARAASFSRRNEGKASLFLEMAVSKEAIADRLSEGLASPSVLACLPGKFISSRNTEPVNVSVKLFPDGYFSVTRLFPRRPKPAKRDDEKDSILGLSEESKSKNAVRRGSRGLTSHGKRLLRSAASVMELELGKYVLGFWTATLPYVQQSELELVALRSSRIIHLLTAKLRYHQEKHGLSGLFCGCWELQSRGALHLHMCLHTKKGRWDKGYLITSELLDALWRESVETVCPELPPVSWVASCEISPVRKSVGAYMAKYISKGSDLDLPSDSPHPSSWYLCSEKLRVAVAEKTTDCRCVAEYSEHVNLPKIAHCLARDLDVVLTKSGVLLSTVFCLYDCVPVSVYGYLNEWRADSGWMLLSALDSLGVSQSSVW